MVVQQLGLVVGARPNFIKAAPLLNAFRADADFSVRLIHTGQHFDADMSQVFFEQLGLPKPDAYLDINQGSYVEQMARIMQALEVELRAQPCDLVVVFGDVNSTLAAALTANKMGLLLAHVEAGLRSFDRSMPEEHNRIVTDVLADLLFTPSADADENLAREGVPTERIHRVGNIMVDSLLRFASHAAKLTAWEEYGLQKGKYALLTLHRQGNVDDADTFDEIMSALLEIGKELPVLFPVHPRTEAQLKEGEWKAKLESGNVRLSTPINYMAFISLMMHARLVLTDSGGIQEETSVLGVPCLTLRENTERPITISEGTNQLAGTSRESILEAFEEVIGQGKPEKRQPELWDGQTAQRIYQVIKAL